MNRSDLLHWLQQHWPEETWFPAKKTVYTITFDFGLMYNQQIPDSKKFEFIHHVWKPSGKCKTHKKRIISLKLKAKLLCW